MKTSISLSITIILICLIFGTIWCQEKFEIWKAKIVIEELAKKEYISYQACSLKGMPQKLTKR